ncbi:MAG TPA: S-layer homology domain-containing protein [Acidimicrobiales bacterium]|nr:S-layer homology domain-containing protein [Acidimicrobiales bacterium]
MTSAPASQSARGHRCRFAVATVLAVLVALVPMTPASAQTFSDVSGPHAGAIEAMAEAGITDGCTPERYCPDEPVTRAQMASFLMEALDLSPEPAPFTDVEGNEHEGAIGAIAASGITDGCTAERYCPAEPVSRAQMASFLARGFGMSDPGETYFHDVTAPHGANAQALAAAGVSDGCVALGLRFCPQKTVSRAQMASFIARSLDLVPRTSVPLRLDPGEQNAHVEALQNLLAWHGYWVGPVDGVYGHLTEQAVLAVQKVHGLARDGIYGPSTRAAMAHLVPPTTRSSSGYVIEFDEDRQVVMLVRDGHPETIFHASGGDESYYTSDGTTYWAETPNGTWDIYRQIDGWRTSHLGELYRPKYFHTDGIAFHGYDVVPPYAASHGCVRVSMEAMDWIWATNAMPIGATVMVYGTPS